ncbi:MAG: hypothetical protein WC238_05540 [Parcubacteria group bacterium]|jgi:hypothetical protein
MGNLEPIEDDDLDLKNKFTGGVEKGEEAGVKKEKAADFVLEKKPESRQEGVVEKDSAYNKILSKVQTQAQPADDKTVATDAHIIHSSDEEESKIETLIKLATTKGVVHAVKVARHLEDNYALDEFHDRLLGEELHDALLKKGLIKEL